MMTSDEPARLLRNWRDELDSAALYAALAQIDRSKAVDPAADITDVRVEEKTGGKTGSWHRP